MAPPLDWRRAFEREATPELYEKAMRYARKRARRVDAIRDQVDEDYVHDVVQAAFADTFVGTLAWDPAVPLEQHVIKAIKSRTRHDRERAQRYPHVSFDTAGSDTELEREVQDALAEEADATYSVVVTADAAMRLGALRKHFAAEADVDVLRLLDAYTAGHYKRHEVLESAGMTAKEYRNATKRLGRHLYKISSLVPRKGRTVPRIIRQRAA